VNAPYKFSLTLRCDFKGIKEKLEKEMFIAMNRFKIKLGFEEDFLAIWKGRDSLLKPCLVL